MKLVKLSDTALFINEKAFKPSDWKEAGMPIIRIQNLTGTSRVYNYYDGEIEDRYVVRKGDLLISWSASLGVYEWKIEDGVLNQHIFKVELKKGIDKKYFYYAILTSIVAMERQVHGSTMKHITKGKFENIKIPLPDLKTQQQIAQTLEQADKARQLRKAANALTNQFLQSSFLSMFGDPVKNEKGWEVLSIGASKCKVQIGPFGTQLHAEDYVANGIPLINPKHIKAMKIVEDNDLTITREKHFELPNYHLKIGDIIMARRGEMGRCAVVSERENGWFCGTGSLYIRPSVEFDSTYLLYVLSSSSIKEKLENDAQGVTMANLNQGIINSLLMPIPPIKLQRKFADIVAETELLRQKQQQSEMELEHLFQGLLQRYFG